MLSNAIAAASLLFNSPPGIVIVQPDAIVQVVCFGIDKQYGPYVRSGTAFRIGPTGIMLSVNHVTTGPAKCFVGKTPITISYRSPNSDFSMIDGDKGAYLQVDCGGFIKGRKYLSLGYARGLDQITSVELTGTGESLKDGQAILTGVFAIVPGMSGGPIIDEETGRVVGTNNVENFEQGFSGSVALKDTPICKGNIA